MNLARMPVRRFVRDARLYVRIFWSSDAPFKDTRWWFDFFGQKPFYQVTTEDYDALVPKNKSVAAGKGQVLVKQLNRRVSESAHSPAIFAPKSGEVKNEMSLDELVRWLITYQNFTGVTDKLRSKRKKIFEFGHGFIESTQFLPKETHFLRRCCWI